jgi:PAS domain S-box-containing protein
MDTINHHTDMAGPPAGEMPAVADYALNNLPIGLMVLDPDGKVAYINQAAARLMGLSRQSLLGSPLADFWPVTAREVALILRDGGKPASLAPSEMENCCMQVMPHTDSGATITICEQGLLPPPAAAAGAADPLTPFYRQIFDSANSSFVVADDKGRVVFINDAAARQFEVMPDAFMGSSVSAFVENNVLSDVISYDVLASGQSVTRMVHSLKTGKHILLTGKPIFCASGEVSLVAVTARDLTELLELQASLQQQKLLASHFKDELAEIKMAELAARGVVAKSPAMMRAMETAAKLARYDTRQILITGESGVGKGLLAKFIHSKSKRASEPFIHINCTALPEQLLEAELFGSEKGSLPAAAPKGRAGHLETSSNGTIYLDEIGGMPPGVQAKLLSFLDTRSYTRMNGRQALTSDATIIASTTQDLRLLTEQKLFRSDLYIRLSVFCLPIPPLRDRRDDLMELSRREIARLNQKYDHQNVLDPHALEALLSHPFPGNVRELLNCPTRRSF